MTLNVVLAKVQLASMQHIITIINKIVENMISIEVICLT